MQGQALQTQEPIITYIVSIIDSRFAGMTICVKNCAIIYAFNYKIGYSVNRANLSVLYYLLAH